MVKHRLPSKPPLFQGRWSLDRVEALQLLAAYLTGHKRKDALMKKHLDPVARHLSEFSRGGSRCGLDKAAGDDARADSLYNAIYTCFSARPEYLDGIASPLFERAYEVELTSDKGGSDFWNQFSRNDLSDYTRVLETSYSGLFWSFRYLEAPYDQRIRVNCTLVEAAPSRTAGMPMAYRIWYRRFTEEGSATIRTASGSLYTAEKAVLWAGSLDTSANFFLFISSKPDRPVAYPAFSSLVVHAGQTGHYMAARTRFVRIPAANEQDWLTKGALTERAVRRIGAVDERAFVGLDLRSEFSLGGTSCEDILSMIANDTEPSGKRPLTRMP